jgi:calcineurin-like phosphoesterase family protein
MNMVKLCGRPLNFNEKIANNWDKLIDKNDTVLHLGDLAIWFGPSRDIWHKFSSQRPGKKFLIRGNHDIYQSYSYALYDYKLLEESFVTEIGQTKICFSHEPQPPEDWDLNIHGHIHNNYHVLDYDFDHLSDKHINMSAEVREYKPWKLKDILNEI